MDKSKWAPANPSPDDAGFYVNPEDVIRDLSWPKDHKEGERPIWPFSCYAPGRNAPKQLIEGAFEQSPEEMRVQYYLARASGQVEQYVSR
jgi:nucleoporin NUP42